MATMHWGHRVERLPQQALAQSGPWVRRLARLGYAAKGVVYATIGVLALQLALGRGGRTTSSRGAIASLAEQPFGALMLGVLSVGLAGYVVWCSAKGLAIRAGYLASAGVHAGLAVFALERVVGARRGGGGDHTREWTARLMAQPFGRVLVALVGVGVLGFALQQAHDVWKRRFLRNLSLGSLEPRRRHGVEQVSRFGIAARAVVFAIVGVFLVRAALDANPREARGLGAALATLAQQPYGTVLLGVVAAGLVAYAVYLFLQARYRRIAMA
jgi:hypothetical protein